MKQFLFYGSTKTSPVCNLQPTMTCKQNNYWHDVFMTKALPSSFIYFTYWLLVSAEFMVQINFSNIIVDRHTRKILEIAYSRKC